MVPLLFDASHNQLCSTDQMAFRKGQVEVLNHFGSYSTIKVQPRNRPHLTLVDLTTRETAQVLQSGAHTTARLKMCAEGQDAAGGCRVKERLHVVVTLECSPIGARH